MAKSDLLNAKRTGDTYETYTETDELVTDAGSAAFILGDIKRAFIKTGLTIYTGAGETGDLLVEDTDYEIINEDFRYTELTGYNCYVNIQIINVSYQTGSLYITYQHFGSYTDATSLNDSPPIGSIQAYVGITAPSRWAIANGAAISKATYSILWGRMSSETVGTAGIGACTFTDAGDLVTCAGHGLATGDNIFFRTIVTTTGISINTNYFVIYVGADTFKVASSLALAQAGTALALTTNGSGTLTYSPFGISGADNFKIPDCRAVSLKGIGIQTINTRAKTAPVLGAVEEDQFQGFGFASGNSAGGSLVNVGEAGCNVLAGLTHANDAYRTTTGSGQAIIGDNGTNGTPRTGTITHDNILGVNYIIKII